MSTELNQSPKGPSTTFVLNGQSYTISQEDGQCIVSKTPSYTPLPTPAPTPPPHQS